MTYVESYSAVYNTDAYDAYQYPPGRGVTESYVKYQMYTNQPAYNVHVGRYGYNDGHMATGNSVFNPAASVTCEYHN